MPPIVLAAMLALTIAPLPLPSSGHSLSAPKSALSSASELGSTSELAYKSKVDPPSDRVTIDTLSVNGTGCRSDTTTVAVSPDKEAFTVLYSTYLAQAGASTKNKDERRKCGITVRLNVPANMTYAVSAVDYRGFAHLEAGASATLSSRYHFQGSGTPAFTEHAFASGLVDDWQVTDTVGAGAEFGKCGKDRKIDIDTELRAQSPRVDSPTSFITMDSTDGEISSTYHLTYRNC